MKASVARPGNYPTEEQEWGRLIWMVSGAQGSSATMSLAERS